MPVRRLQKDGSMAPCWDCYYLLLDLLCRQQTALKRMPVTCPSCGTLNVTMLSAAFAGELAFGPWACVFRGYPFQFNLKGYQKDNRVASFSHRETSPSVHYTAFRGTKGYMRRRRTCLSPQPEVPSRIWGAGDLVPCQECSLELRVAGSLGTCSGLAPLANRA